jgi:hypothetical protein
MALFLVTSLIDEGMYASRFVVVEAESELAVAAHMLSHPHQWQRFLSSAYPSDWRGGGSNYGSLLDCTRSPEMTPERFLELIGMTRVDGDSWAQLAIHPVMVKSLEQVDTSRWEG